MPSVRTDDGKLIVEAPTAEAALELVAERLGTRARIAGVERVRRGGVGGFFARELVQVTATGGEPTGPDAPERAQRSAGDAGGTAPDSPVDRLLRELANRDDPFATALHDQLAPGPPVEEGGPGAGPGNAPAATAVPRQDDGDTPDVPAPAKAAPAYAAPVRATRAAAIPARLLPAAGAATSQPFGRPDRATGGSLDAAVAPLPGTPQWSVRNLCRLGLPSLLSAGEAAALEADDIGWTHALAEALRPLCRPLPTGPIIVVGPAAERLAGPLDLTIHWPGQQTPPESFVAPISGRFSEREWLAQVRGGRQLHLVVGGPAWRGLLFDDPVVLSHDAPSMCEAVSLAFQLDVGLGYTCDASGAVTRTNPIDLATAIRRLLPVHP